MGLVFPIVSRLVVFLASYITSITLEVFSLETSFDSLYHNVAVVSVTIHWFDADLI